MLQNPTPQSASAAFYAQLPPIVSLADLTHPAHYHPAPRDWWVFITDVRGSTAAVAAGRYKEVNTIGAASILSAQNACPGLDFPFVFGGDGATLMVPPEGREAVAKALSALSRKSLLEFGLELRVGCVPVADILSRGVRLLVARRQLSEGNHIALFAGGGLNEATAMVKSSERHYLVDQDVDSPPAMDGLECRWCAVPARRDGMLSLIIQAEGEHLPLYEMLLSSISRIAPEAMPITPANLPDRWPPEFLMHESRLKHQGRWAQWLHYLGVAALTGLLTLIVRRTRDDLQSAAGRYIASLCQNNDYLKLDDCLRMVIDVSDAQREAIADLLDDAQRQHGIRWGWHFSGAALFTCVVRSPELHLHFVDGDEGGYTAAARDMDVRSARHEEPA
ncbi:MAG: DUF3095 family protein [Oxalobacteraceae bacterium]